MLRHSVRVGAVIRIVTSVCGMCVQRQGAVTRAALPSRVAQWIIRSVVTGNLRWSNSGRCSVLS